MVKTRRNPIKNDPGALFVEKPDFRVFYSVISITGNELIIKLTVPQYYICAAKLLKGHKSSVKNDPWALFVQNPDFLVLYPLIWA